MSAADFINMYGDNAVTSAGGFDPGPMETMLQDYGLRSQGPNEDDAIILNRTIDGSVRPVNCRKRSFPVGRICSLTNRGDVGTMIPGVWDTDEYPVACMMVGSDADSMDVLGGPPSGSPADYQDAQVAMKLQANIPFWVLSTSVIFETSAFRPEDVPALAPTTTLTAIPSLTDFDVAGVLTPGTLYVDHIIGSVVERPAPCGINASIQTLRMIGLTIPRIRRGTLNLLRD